MKMFKKEKFTIITDRSGMYAARYIAHDLKHRRTKVGCYGHDNHVVTVFTPGYGDETVEIAIKALFSNGYKIRINKAERLAVVTKVGS